MENSLGILIDGSEIVAKLPVKKQLLMGLVMCQQPCVTVETMSECCLTLLFPQCPTYKEKRHHLAVIRVLSQIQGHILRPREYILLFVFTLKKKEEHTAFHTS